ncbi:MAG: type III PLP-dependent enzyme [Alphaproteobacteria bacterium]|nr:MAG: type III PLP-dependent enzyme [Alphaproteobacteria bacterium]
MKFGKTIWDDPVAHVRAVRPDGPVLYFAPAVLQATARRFLAGFPGLVTYAVKANPELAVLQNLAEAGIGAFDVASVAEVSHVRQYLPEAALHFNNPVRAADEVRAAARQGVRSWSVDALSELGKLCRVLGEEAGPSGRPLSGHEVSVRFAIAAAGGTYDFSSKFGADAAEAAEILDAAGRAGAYPSLTFHPGTQCTEPAVWRRHIEAAAAICRKAGVTPWRLNVGGGFPSRRLAGEEPALDAIFAEIRRAAVDAFEGRPPALVCEPGRAMVAEAFTLGVRVRAIRRGDVFINDGVYGGFSELPLMGATDRVRALSPDGRPRRGELRPVTVFGPTCDSVDRLPGRLALPADIAEGDYLLFSGLGAYSLATATRFNGFGDFSVVTVAALDGPAGCGGGAGQAERAR